MPLFSSRNSPSLAQRLSDRRRALALVGLAAAALIGAKAARRKLAGDAVDYAPPLVPPTADLAGTPVAAEPDPATPREGGPIPAIDDTPPPGAATVEPPLAAEHASSVPADPALDEPTEPNTEELAAAEVAVLAILSQEGRLETDRTALVVATTLEREIVEVAALLRKLHNQGHVAGDEYTATGEKIWNVTDAGAGRLD